MRLTTQLVGPHAERQGFSRRALLGIEQQMALMQIKRPQSAEADD